MVTIFYLSDQINKLRVAVGELRQETKGANFGDLGFTRRAISLLNQIIELTHQLIGELSLNSSSAPQLPVIKVRIATIQENCQQLKSNIGKLALSTILEKELYGQLRDRLVSDLCTVDVSMQELDRYLLLANRLPAIYLLPLNLESSL